MIITREKVEDKYPYLSQDTIDKIANSIIENNLLLKRLKDKDGGCHNANIK